MATKGEREGSSLAGIQAARGIAALMVAAFHINAFILPERLYSGQHASPVFDMGYAGVEFFFALSGFIMVFAHQKDFGRSSQVSAFLWKRFVRIYPIYWVIFGALTAAYFIAPHLGPPHARDPAAIATSFLLWPTPADPILQVAWTLRHEMLFYLIFAIVILNRTVGVMLIAAWALATSVAAFGRLEFPWSFLFSPYNLLFVMGMASAWLHGRLKQRPAAWSWMLLVVGAIAFYAVGLAEAVGGVEWNHALRTVLYGAGATLMIAGLAAKFVKPPRFFQFLGDASYSIYLIHMPALIAAAVALKVWGAPWMLPPAAMMTLLLLVVIAVGAATHVLLEKPMLRYLRRWGQQPREPAAAPNASVRQ